MPNCSIDVQDVSGVRGRNPYLVLTMQQPTHKRRVSGVICGAGPNTQGLISFSKAGRAVGVRAQRLRKVIVGGLTFVTIPSPRR